MIGAMTKTIQVDELSGLEELLAALEAGGRFLLKKGEREVAKIEAEPNEPTSPELEAMLADENLGKLSPDFAEAIGDQKLVAELEASRRKNMIEAEREFAAKTPEELDASWERLKKLHGAWADMDDEEYESALEDIRRHRKTERRDPFS